MAEETTKGTAKSAKATTAATRARRGGPVSGGLASVQGEYTDDRPAERRPGTREHLGDDPVYAGAPSPYVEGDEDARNR
jgi:hypothetical protein